MDEYEWFCEWLKENGHTALPWQLELAKTLMEMPVASGKTWLIDRLYEFDDEVQCAEDARYGQGCE